MPAGVSWASRNMYILGAIVVLGLILHLYNFWYKMQFAEIIGDHNLGAFGPTDGAAYIADLFSNPVYCIIYLVWFVAIWFHLTHGFWSAFQTIGWDNQIWLGRLKCSRIFLLRSYSSVSPWWLWLFTCAACAAVPAVYANPFFC